MTAAARAAILVLAGAAFFVAVVVDPDGASPGVTFMGLVAVVLLDDPNGWSR